MKKHLTAITVTLLAAVILWAALPLYGKNYIPTHDGEYHIIRIAEFARMLGAGYLIPRWAPDMNSGYGIPIFNYNYPFPDYIGSLVRVFTRDAVYAFQMSMGLGYIAVGIGAYVWLFVLFGQVPALVGGIVASFTPYLFVDTYVRGSIGEVWATVFLFLSFYFIEKKRFIWFAIAYGLLILSHNILAMLYTPFLVGYVLIRDKKAALWMLGGIGMSAFFWMPALLEAKYVVGLNTVNFRQYFVQIYELLIPSWGTGFAGTGLGNAMSVQIGIVPLIAMVGAILLMLRKQTYKYKNLLWYFIAVLSAAVFFMLPISGPVWEVVKPLQLMQYPWRLLSFVVPVAGFSAAYWISSVKKKPWGLILAVLAIAFSASYARPVLYAPRNEVYYMTRANFTDGTSSMGNSFSTVWSGWKGSRPAKYVNVVNGSVLQLISQSYLDKLFMVKMNHEGEVSMSILYFPGWTAVVDATKVPIHYQIDGTIRFLVPEGRHTVRVRFTETPVREIADIISILTIVSLVGLLFYEHHNRHNTA